VWSGIMTEGTSEQGRGLVGMGILSFTLGFLWNESEPDHPWC
jgi:hypothetical protein